MKIYLYLCLIAMFGCTHSIYSAQVEQQRLDDVEFTVQDVCKDRQCTLENCWQETKSIIACNVGFLFSDPEAQRETLQVASRQLAEKGLTVGFCGRNSPGTQLTYLALAVIVPSLIFGGSSSGGYAGAYYVTRASEKQISDVMEEACASDPIEDAPVNRRGR
jgi:hypothetical protein